MEKITVDIKDYSKVEYRFGIDIQLLYDDDGNCSIGWAPIGSEVSNLWRAEEGENYD